jgi:hypothetical protein
MQQLPTFNFGLTKNFFFIYRTLSMRQKTKNYRIRGSNAQKIFFLFYFPSHIPIWVWFVQKTRAKNSHAWAPLKVPKREIFVTELIILSHPIWIGDLRTKAKNRFVRIVRLLFAILVFFR